MEEDKTIKFNSDGKLKIMHITDTHIQDGNASATLWLIEKACEIYKKHLIKFNPTLKDFPTALDEGVNMFRKQLL